VEDVSLPSAQSPKLTPYIIQLGSQPHRNPSLSEKEEHDLGVPREEEKGESQEGGDGAAMQPLLRTLLKGGSRGCGSNCVNVI
jgi:hypothetical protein